MPFPVYLLCVLSPSGPDRVSHLKSLWALYFRLLDTAPLARSIPMWTSCVGSSLIHFTLETEWVCRRWILLLSVLHRVHFHLPDSVFTLQGGGFREEFREVLQFVAKCWSRMQHVHYGLQVLLDLIRTSSLVVFRVCTTCPSDWECLLFLKCPLGSLLFLCGLGKQDTSDVQDVRQFLLGCSYILCTVVFADPSMVCDLCTLWFSPQ